MPRLIYLLSLICLLLVVTPHASAQWSTGVIETDVEGVKDFWEITDVKKGEKIKVLVKVKNTGEVPIVDYWISCQLTKPDGSKTNKLWYHFKGSTLGPGVSKKYYLRTGIVADQVGTWEVHVTFTDRDKNSLDSDTKTFRVTGAPKGEITIEQVVGYTSLTAMVVGGLYLIRRMFV